MGDVCLFGSICTSFSNRNFVSPVSGIDESDPGSVEQSFEERLQIRTCQVSLNQFDIRQRCKFLGDEAFVGSHLCANMPADSTGDTDKRRTLTSSRVDRCNDFFGHYKNLIGKDSASDAILQATRVFFRTRLPVGVRGLSWLCGCEWVLGMDVDWWWRKLTCAGLASKVAVRFRSVVNRVSPGSVNASKQVFEGTCR